MKKSKALRLNLSLGKTEGLLRNRKRRVRLKNFRKRYDILCKMLRLYGYMPYPVEWGGRDV